jgi:hypothetical protein
LNGIFRLAIVAAGVLAVAYIIIGGFEYMVAGAREGKKDGRERIEKAIFGLILLLLSYVILNTINPDLLNLDPFRTSLTPGPSIERPTGSSNTGGVSEEDRRSIRSEDEVRALRARPECRDAVNRAVRSAANLTCTTVEGNDCSDTQYPIDSNSVSYQSAFARISVQDQNPLSDKFGESINRTVRYDAVVAELRANPTPGCEL